MTIMIKNYRGEISEVEGSEKDARQQLYLEVMQGEYLPKLKKVKDSPIRVRTIDYLNESGEKGQYRIVGTYNKVHVINFGPHSVKVEGSKTLEPGERLEKIIRNVEINLIKSAIAMDWKRQKKSKQSYGESESSTFEAPYLNVVSEIKFPPFTPRYVEVMRMKDEEGNIFLTQRVSEGDRHKFATQARIYGSEDEDEVNINPANRRYWKKEELRKQIEAGKLVPFGEHTHIEQELEETEKASGF